MPTSIQYEVSDTSFLSDVRHVLSLCLALPVQVPGTTWPWPVVKPGRCRKSLAKPNVTKVLLPIWKIYYVLLCNIMYTIIIDAFFSCHCQAFSRTQSQLIRMLRCLAWSHTKSAWLIRLWMISLDLNNHCCLGRPTRRLPILMGSALL